METSNSRFFSNCWRCSVVSRLYTACRVSAAERERYSVGTMRPSMRSTGEELTLMWMSEARFETAVLKKSRIFI